MRRSPFSVKREGGAVVVKARGRVDALAWALAAYSLIGEAYVSVGASSAWLRPKDGAPAAPLAERLQALYAERAAFLRQARSARGSRLALLAKTLALADQAGAGQPDAFGELPAERKAEIAALLAEPPVEDVFGIARSWSETRAR